MQRKMAFVLLIHAPNGNPPIKVYKSFGVNNAQIKQHCLSISPLSKAKRISKKTILARYTYIVYNTDKEGGYLCQIFRLH